jgi:hypothetical protein
MPMSAEQLVLQSLLDVKYQNEDARQKFYQRLSDHYHADLDGDLYFPKREYETKERYASRPRRVFSLGLSAIDVLTGSMLGDGVTVSIDDPNSNAAYQEIAERNHLHGAHALAIAEQASTYGWTINRIVSNVSPAVHLDQIEFEVVEPRFFKVHYNSTAIGRSVKRINGVSFISIYDPSDGMMLPPDTKLKTGERAVYRVEVLTPATWMVYLDGIPTPRDPITDELWIPAEDGKNPFGLVPATCCWNVHQMGAFEGRSDIDPGYRVAEDINRAYSALIDNIDRYHPTLTVPGNPGEIGSSIIQGLGIALEYDRDGTPPDYIIPATVIDTLMAPLKLQLNLFFSSVHTPASSHGLGGIFGDARAAESGKAKFYEANRLQRHVIQKRTNFEMFLKDQYRNLAQGMTTAGISTLKPDAVISVGWESDIVPISAEELRDRIYAEMKEGVRSHLEAVMTIRGIPDTDDGRERAAEILEEIAISAGKVAPVSRAEQELNDRLDK